MITVADRVRRQVVPASWEDPWTRDNEVETKINAMDNMELLQRISDAIEARILEVLERGTVR